MKKITEQSIKCFLNNKKFSSGNMKVTVNTEKCSLLLHGNEIAFLSANGIYISDCGWQTTTTKERLNGLLDTLGKRGLYQKDFIWYWKNEEVFPSDKFVKIA